MRLTVNVDSRPAKLVGHAMRGAGLLLLIGSLAQIALVLAAPPVGTLSFAISLLSNGVFSVYLICLPLFLTGGPRAVCKSRLPSAAGLLRVISAALGLLWGIATIMAASRFVKLIGLLDERHSHAGWSTLLQALRSPELQGLAIDAAYLSFAALSFLVFGNAGPVIDDGAVDEATGNPIGSS